ncbi:MAG: flagellar assembly protein FliW [Acidobacteriota bacterium]|nr:flagellar assembly protein FliW [Acidobacteriota bacterium]
MTKIPSVTFGEVEIDEAKVFEFPEGIPGLKGITQYFIIDRVDLAPFKWLQACQPGYLSLMMLDPVLIDNTYKVNFKDEHRKIIGDCEESELLTQAIIVVPEDPKQMTANLLAPLLFNTKTRKGMQVVVEGHRNNLRVKVIKD